MDTLGLLHTNTRDHPTLETRKKFILLSKVNLNIIFTITKILITYENYLASIMHHMYHVK